MYSSSLVLLISIPFIVANSDLDTSGYIIYCPCMGRFGNQADQFLGSLAFAKSINRTLVLPPWVEYHSFSATSHQIPFDTYFKVNALQNYHRVITMESFMKNLAPEIWPAPKRYVFCYSHRHGSKTNDCNAKDGNPFGPFWNKFNVDFTDSIFYGSDLSFYSDNPDVSKAWNKKYTPEKYPVLAFVGPPAGFPVEIQNVQLQKYLHWSDKYESHAREFINKHIGSETRFLGIHLRNGADWPPVCDHIKHAKHLFASPQCLGPNNEYGRLTNELCNPSKETILKQVKQTISTEKLKEVFVAADRDHMVEDLTKYLDKKISIHRLSEDNPHLDLVILGRSTHFIGNCISSFTSIVSRHRMTRFFPNDTRINLPTSFWAFKPFIREEL